ncbi:hypothetical protein PR048_026879 [Dryococelus australis]|uniref:Uncharacterized protein n=1 Tax=Dryococelus australis TaxID=614101 RepID=A0ABQ9GMK9_9NEOP|nr:hypothetical protein PR048_026879 [Dryococelus australis]
MKFNLDISDKRGTHHNRPLYNCLWKECMMFSRKVILILNARVVCMGTYSEVNSSLYLVLHTQTLIHLVAAETEVEQNRITMQSTLHHRKAETTYKVLHGDVVMSKSNPTYVVLCTDMQQVLYCPTLHHSSMFYQRQFSTYNQGVHNMGTEKPYMFEWNGLVAKCGSSEVTSCILKYIELHCEALKVNEIRRLVVWSDLYHPKQWLEVNVNASPAFSAYYMDKEDFIYLSAIEGMFKKQPDFKITSFHWIQFSSEEPNTVGMRISHNTLQH